MILLILKISQTPSWWVLLPCWGLKQLPDLGSGRSFFPLSGHFFYYLGSMGYGPFPRILPARVNLTNSPQFKGRCPCLPCSLLPSALQKCFLAGCFVAVVCEGSKWVNMEAWTRCPRRPLLGWHSSYQRDVVTSGKTTSLGCTDPFLVHWQWWFLSSFVFILICRSPRHKAIIILLVPTVRSPG